LAVDPAGVVYASWFERHAGGGHALKVSKLTGSRWSAPVTAAAGDSFFVNWADTPILVAAGEGHLALSWPWKSGAGTYSYDVRIAQSFDDGRSWSNPVIPHRDGTPTEHGFVSLATDGDGVRAVWLDGRKTAATGSSHGHGDEHGGEMTLRSATLDRNGAIANEAELDGRVCDCCQTAMAVGPAGPIVAYRDRGADEIRDLSIVRGSGGSWSEPEPLGAEGWKMPACPVNGPAMSAAGQWVAVAWYTGAADDPAVYVARSHDGGKSFESPRRVDAKGQGTLGRVGTTIRDDGATLVSWIRAEPGGARILARGITADGTMGSPLTVAFTSVKRASGFPRLVASGERVIFAWTEAGNPSRIRAATASWSKARKK
jgi:hypothetical protein